MFIKIKLKSLEEIVIPVIHTSLNGRKMIKYLYNDKLLYQDCIFILMCVPYYSSMSIRN